VSADEDRPQPDPGEPGASARREFERRSTARRHTVLMHHPFADKEAVRAAEGPAHERAFDYGSDGERWVARVLAKRLNPGAFVLHDRAIPGQRGNIDHMLVEAAVAERATPTPVHGALCFVQTELPPGRRLMFERLHVVDADQLAKRINVSTALLPPAGVRALVEELGRRFPPA
jgi:hypothetical protein